MPEFTPNYNLVKPGAREAYDIGNFNQNAQIIDENLSRIETDFSQQLSNIAIDAERFIVADGVTDDYQNITNLINTVGVKDIIFPKNKRVLYNQPLELIGVTLDTIDFNGCTLITPNGAIKSRKNYSNPPTIKNGVFKGNGTGNGFEIGRGLAWGASLKLENVEISNFKIGLYLNCIFSSSFKDLKIVNNKLAIYLGRDAGGAFCNVNKFSNIYIDYNKYGIYMHHSYSALFEHATIEHGEYSVIVGGSVDFNEFTGTWFEANSIADVTFGNLNLDTMVLTKSATDSALKGVNFKDTRYFNEIPFIDNDFKFSSLHYNNGNHFNNDSTFINNLNYKNIVESFNTAFSDANPSDVQEFGYKATPFGQMYVAKISGTNLKSSLRLLTRLYIGKISLNDVFLVKSIVKIDRPDKPRGEHNVSFRLLSGLGTQLSAWESRKVPLGRYFEVSAIVKLTTVSDNGQVFLSLQPNRNWDSGPSHLGEMSVDIDSVMAINLTQIFGAGNEPSAGMEVDIAKLMPYRHPFKPDIGRWVGDKYFDTTTNKELTWNGVNWVDAMGTII